MADSSEAQKRREMRRRKILENSEQRMNKLHGTIERTESFEHLDRAVIDSEDLCPDPPDLSINEMMTASLQSFPKSSGNPCFPAGLDPTQFEFASESGYSDHQTSEPPPVPVWCQRLERWRQQRALIFSVFAAIVQLAVLVLPEWLRIQNFLLPFVVMETMFYLAHIYNVPYSSSMGMIRVFLMMLGVQQTDKLLLWMRYFSFLFSSWLDLNIYLFVTLVFRGLFLRSPDDIMNA